MEKNAIDGKNIFDSQTTDQDISRGKNETAHPSFFADSSHFGVQLNTKFSQSNRYCLRKIYLKDLSEKISNSDHKSR